MLAVLAALAFAIAALIAFTSLSGLSVLGLVALGLALLSLHLLSGGPFIPWRRNA